MKTSIVSFIAILSFGLISCSNTENGMVEPSYSIYENGSNVEVGAVGERPNRDSLKKDTVKKAPPTIFGDLLIKLNLTPEQKTLVEVLLKQNKECRESCISTLRTAEREIIMNARIEEQKIKDAVKAGTITKEVSRRELSQLKKSTQEKLKSLPKDKVRECLQGCDTQFLNSLKEILTPEQKITLERWIASRQKRGTTDDKNPKGRG
jgi:Spy/CpxP family protein refolding chaperone